MSSIRNSSPNQSLLKFQSVIDRNRSARDTEEKLKAAFLEPRGGSTKELSGIFSGLGSIASRRVEWNARGISYENFAESPALQRNTTSQQIERTIFEMARAWLKVLEAAGGSVTRVDVQSHNSLILTGAGTDIIRTSANSVVHAGGGNDDIDTHGHALVFGGDGGDAISTYANSTVSGGEGNDWISAYENGFLSGGDGDDIIEAYHGSTISGGAGNDFIDTCGHDVIDAGDGDDIVQTNGNSLIQGGHGNDVLRSGGQAEVYGGDGDDFVFVAGGALADGGDGDDVVAAGDGGTIIGGKGDDLIFAARNAQVLYAQGDGNDLIDVHDQGVQVILGEGITRENTQITISEDEIVVTFGTAGDSLKFGVYGGPIYGLNAAYAYEVVQRGTAMLVFSDGQTLKLDKQS